MKKQISFSKFALIVMLICILIIFLTYESKAQVYAGAEFGAKGWGLNCGYLSTKYVEGLELKAAFNVPYTRNENEPKIFYSSIGYSIKLTNYEEDNFEITPSIGHSRYSVSDLSKAPYAGGSSDTTISKSTLLLSFEAGKDFTRGAGNTHGRFYAFATHSEEWFYGMGLRLFIK